MSENNNEYNIPAWLKNLQENSWELELLISGGAIFSLFQLSDLFIDFIFTIKMTSHIPGTGIFIVIGMLGIKLLTVGFISHLLLRAFWLGMICINYVYPEGIRDKKLKLKRPFKERYDIGENLKSEIINTDRASGIIMFISIISTFLLIGFVFFILAFLTLPGVLFGLKSWLISIVFIVGIIYYIDLFSFGFFRKTKGISYLTYPLFRIIDVITLRIAYQKALVLFSSNLQKWKAILGFSVMVFISTLLTYSSIYQTNHWPNLFDARTHIEKMTAENKWMGYGNYMDQIDAKKPRPAIQSEIITSNFLQLFVPYDIDYQFGIPEDKAISDYIIVSIDNNLYQKIDWYSYYAKENDQLGIKGFIDIEQLARGKHLLRIEFQHLSSRNVVIPFWKDTQ